MKRILSIILAVVMIATTVSCAFTSFAQEEQSQDVQVYDSFEFGRWPQTYISDPSLIDALNSIYVHMTNYGIAAGSASGSSCGYAYTRFAGLWYADINYNGERYRKVKFTEKRPILTTESAYNVEGVYYFRWDPIVWHIFEVGENAVTAVSHGVLDGQPYSYENNAVTWQQSFIRGWLNEIFYAEAFSANEKLSLCLQSRLGATDYISIPNKSEVSNTGVFYGTQLNKGFAQGYSVLLDALDINTPFKDRTTYFHVVADDGSSNSLLSASSTLSNGKNIYVRGLKPVISVTKAALSLGSDTPESYTPGTHEHVFDRPVRISEAAANIATCTYSGTYYYSCRYCTENGVGDLGYFGFVDTSSHHTPVQIISDEAFYGYATNSKYVKYYYYTCSVCGEVIKNSSTSAVRTFSYTIPHEHNMYLYDYLLPTCTTAGYYRYKCAYSCGTIFTDTLPALGHKKVKMATDLAFALPATETEPALYYYTCAHCGKVFNRTEDGGDGEMFEYTPNNHTHKIVVLDEVPAGCYKTGSRTTACEICGGECTTQVVGTSLGHNMVNRYYVTEPTCTKTGKVYQTCDRCGYSTTKTVGSLGHDYSVISDRVLGEATCQKGTVYAKLCSRCGAYFSNVNAGFEDVDSKLPHEPVAIEDPSAICTPGDSVHYTVYYYTCKNCGVIIDDPNQTFLAGELQHEHAYAEIAREPATCTGYGLITYKCTSCTSSLTESIEPLGHVKGEVLEEIEATCTAKPATKYSCERCGESFTEKYGKKLGHDYSIRTLVSEATCTTDAVYQYTCSRCEKVGSTETQANTRLGHIPTEYSKTEPTCTRYGKINYLCERCHAYWTETAGEPTGIHHYQLAETEEPTCNRRGIRYYACVDCYDTYEEEFGEQVDHDLYLRFVVAATCTNAGTLTYTCKVCGKDVQQKTPARGHDYSIINNQNPTCSKPGEITSVCSTCGDVKTETIPALQHDFEQTDIKQPTCIALGEIINTCTNCGEVRVEYFGEYTTHNYELSTVIPATCTQAGYKLYTCSICSQTKEEILPATGHSFSLRETTEPTCQEPGKEIYICDGCGEVKQKSVSPVVSHDYRLSDTTDPTCTSKGAYTYACSFCGDVMVEEIAQLGHDFCERSATVFEAATCYHGNIYYGKCSRCGLLSIANTFEDESSTLAHKPSKVITDETVRTPKTDSQEATYYYTCSQCGLLLKDMAGYENMYFIDESQHVHDYQLVETIAPTCYSVGLKVYRCEGCGGGFRVITAQLTEHKIGEIIEQRDPSCEAPGSITYRCEYCGEEFTKTQGVSLGHSFTEYSDEIYRPATCTENAIYYAKCSRCNTVSYSMNHLKTAENSALTHSLIEVTSQEALRTPAQCDSYATYYYSCSRCERIIKDSYFSDTSTELKEHDYVLDTQLSTASCTSSGELVYACRNCEATYSETYDDPLGHRYTYLRDMMHTPATCAEDETFYKVFRCETCGDEYTDYSEVYTRPGTANESLHRVEEFVTQTEPTCTESGVQSGVCTICDEEVEKEMPALGHDFNDKVYNVYTLVTPASCGTNALYNYSCTRCGEVDSGHTFELEGTALEHDFTKRDMSERALRTKQTLTQAATYYFTCMNCNALDMRNNHYFTDSTYKPILKNLVKYGEEFQFGMWPQSLVEDEALIAQLEQLDAAPISFNYKYTTTMGMFYDTVDMSYADVFYGGDRYRMVSIGSYRPYTLQVSPLFIESYQSNNGYDAGNTYWFKWEPIVWQVLSVNGIKAELVSKSVLDAGYYTEDYSSASSVTWKESAVRAWLNDSFYQCAFSEDEQSYIMSETHRSSYYFFSEDNVDNVYLLSLDDLFNRTLPYQRKAFATDYCRAQGIYARKNGKTTWLTRTQEYDRANVIIADENGAIDTYFTTTQLGGIRAAITLSMTKGYKSADLNSDGYIDIADISIVLKCFGEAAEDEKEAVDLNDNASVDAMDISILLLEENYGNIG